jgi:hypothetical protein
MVGAGFPVRRGRQQLRVSGLGSGLLPFEQALPGVRHRPAHHHRVGGHPGYRAPVSPVRRPPQHRLGALQVGVLLSTGGAGAVRGGAGAGAAGVGLFAEPLVGFEPTTARLRIECSTPELQWRAHQYSGPSNTGAHRCAPPIPCPGADSNRDAFRHYPLKIACLPVSPPGRAGEQDTPRETEGQATSRLSGTVEL